MVMSGSQRSKEEDVQKISTSVFVTNFPNGYGAKDLWNTCKLYGHVVDFLFLTEKQKQVPGWVLKFEEDGEEGYDVNDRSHEDDTYGGVSEKLKDVEGESDREEVPETNFEGLPNKSIFEGNSVRNWDGEVVIMGDFNEVCDISERFGSIFNKHGAEAFNSFIVNAGLVEARLHKESLNSRKSILKGGLADLDGVIDKGEGSDVGGHRRREVVRLIQEVEKVDAMEVAQKAKIKWSIEGD
nr:nucleotide-binding alpha-beta plait domain-containing protein [Tanacetum cinerariifolium]